MPCSDSRSDDYLILPYRERAEIAEKKATMLTQFLCSLLTKIGEGESIAIEGRVCDWWDAHREWDEARARHKRQEINLSELADASDRYSEIMLRLMKESE